MVNLKHHNSLLISIRVNLVVLDHLTVNQDLLIMVVKIKVIIITVIFDTTKIRIPNLPRVGAVVSKVTKFGSVPRRMKK